MRRIVTAACLVGALAVPVVAGSVALADPTNRTGGAITSPESPTPANGGDNGWGNCGHNSSGGNPHTGDNGSGGGNGGDHKSACTTVPTDSGGGPAN
jgi:uncharacterized low-complexity protein